VHGGQGEVADVEIINTATVKEFLTIRYGMRKERRKLYQTQLQFNTGMSERFKR